MVIMGLSILGAAFLMRSVSERVVASKYFDSTQAFWLAEAGINQAIKNLRPPHDFAAVVNIGCTLLPNTGMYTANIGEVFDETETSAKRMVTARGYIPANCNCDPNCSVTRIVEAEMLKFEKIPPYFYDNAIYAAGNVNIGSNCPVNGDVFSGGTIAGTVNGTTTQDDPDLNNDGLPLLSFDELVQKSIDQGWYDPITHTTTYPTASFYHDPISPTHPYGVPNVVFVNGDFTLVGGKQVVKGFIVVGGDTIYDAEIGGNALIDGCLYTRGDIWLHGGGGKIINVNGGIWAGGTVLLNGNEQIDYNKAYMDAIKEGLHPNFDVQVTSWRETQNPF